MGRRRLFVFCVTVLHHILDHDYEDGGLSLDNGTTRSRRLSTAMWALKSLKFASKTYSAPLQLLCILGRRRRSKGCDNDRSVF